MEFGVLGPLLVRDANGIRPISATKQRTLLATLLLNANSVVSSEELRGNPLADITSAAPRAHRQSITETRLRTLGRRIDADLRLGRHGELIAELRGLTPDHPLREQLHAQLILALYRDGGQADALAGHRQLRENLVRELGVEPNRDVRQLHQRILRSDPDLDGTPVAALPLLAQLPGGVPDFTGRVAQVARVTDSLRGEHRSVPVVAIISAGGIGKSTLALHVAHRLRDRFPDGQLYAHLACTVGLPMEPDQVLAQFLRDLGVDAAAEVRELLRELDGPPVSG
ncbi:MAG TPA: AfsR/SARP family transcriptional regulator [Pseudonocardiaceae bacterium]|nr:AfsR/SARP family transcriptional regulator [Pseudonocardiaceae bacterium]